MNIYIFIPKFTFVRITYLLLTLKYIIIIIIIIKSCEIKEAAKRNFCCTKKDCNSWMYSLNVKKKKKEEERNSCCCLNYFNLCHNIEFIFIFGHSNSNNCRGLLWAFKKEQHCLCLYLKTFQNNLLPFNFKVHLWKANQILLIH